MCFQPTICTRFRPPMPPKRQWNRVKSCFSSHSLYLFSSLICVCFRLLISLINYSCCPFRPKIHLCLKGIVDLVSNAIVSETTICVGEFSTLFHITILKDSVFLTLNTKTRIGKRKFGAVRSWPVFFHVLLRLHARSEKIKPDCNCVWLWMTVYVCVWVGSRARAWIVNVCNWITLSSDVHVYFEWKGPRHRHEAHYELNKRTSILYPYSKMNLC